jgi:hypothetical protein
MPPAYAVAKDGVSTPSDAMFSPSAAVGSELVESSRSLVLQAAAGRSSAASIGARKRTPRNRDVKVINTGVLFVT